MIVICFNVIKLENTFANTKWNEKSTNNQNIRLVNL